MRHNRDGRKLNRTASHRRAMLRNMVTSLLVKERIFTTTAKAKETRRLAERMITFARRGDLSSRRHVAKTIQDPVVLKKLFEEIGPRYVDRPGGYTRVLKLGNRRGDGAERAILELVGADEEGRKKKKNPRKTYHKVEIPKAPVIDRGEAEGVEKAPEGAGEAKVGETAESAAEATEVAAEEKARAASKAGPGTATGKGASSGSKKKPGKKK
jgi:large subunit ribosomal protein L17